MYLSVICRSLFVSPVYLLNQKTPTIGLVSWHHSDWRNKKVNVNTIIVCILYCHMLCLSPTSEGSLTRYTFKISSFARG